jgi:hypothetical protein
MNRRVSALALAERWMLDSGVQVPGRSPSAGAFNAWYDFESRRFQYVYPEITGYGITALLDIRSRHGGRGLLKRAEAAGDWVIRRAMHPCGGIRPRDAYERQERSAVFAFERRLVVTFDSGMVLFGLTNLHEATGKTKYLNAARRVGDFLVDKAQKRDGSFHACYEPSRKRWIHHRDKWSTQSGPYHAKLALGLLDLGRLTGRAKYIHAAQRVCDWAVKGQTSSGRFICYEEDGSTHLHPHLYSAEGLLCAGLTLGRRDYLRSAARAVSWALGQVKTNGGLPCRVGARTVINANERSDTLAQTLRLGAACVSLELLTASETAKLSLLERRLLSYQRLKSPQKGGFYYGREMNGEGRDHVNFWCTAFALQGLAFREDVSRGRSVRCEFFV